MDELGVQLIFAQSPQAKGRVERAAGTFQDRLVTELRLAGATTIDDANRVLEGFLPRFNGRFKVPTDSYPDVVYPAAVVRSTDNVQGAEAMLEFLQSDAGKEIFRGHGFTPLE